MTVYLIKSTTHRANILCQCFWNGLSGALLLSKRVFNSHWVEIHLKYPDLLYVFTQRPSFSNYQTGTRWSWWREWGREYSSLSVSLCWWAAAQCQHRVYSLLLLTEARTTLSLPLFSLSLTFSLLVTLVHWLLCL